MTLHAPVFSVETEPLAFAFSPCFAGACFNDSVPTASADIMSHRASHHSPVAFQGVANAPIFRRIASEAKSLCRRFLRVYRNHYSGAFAG